jgi:hypothetical protein
MLVLSAEREHARRFESGDLSGEFVFDVAVLHLIGAHRDDHVAHLASAASCQ